MEALYLVTHGNLTQFQMPEENKNTCRNYELSQFGKNAETFVYRPTS